MKAYKIDLSMYEGKVREFISELVLKKAAEMKHIFNINRAIAYEENEYMFFRSNELEQERSTFTPTDYTDISVADFLALTTAKDEPTFKPFDKVLVRDEPGDRWSVSLFSNMVDDAYQYNCIDYPWRQCIPYEGNEHLLGTTEESK